MEHKGAQRQGGGVLSFRGCDHLGRRLRYEPWLLVSLVIAYRSQRKAAGVFASDRNGGRHKKGTGDRKNPTQELYIKIHDRYL